MDATPVLLPDVCCLTRCVRKRRQFGASSEQLEQLFIARPDVVDSDLVRAAKSQDGRRYPVTGIGSGVADPQLRPTTARRASDRVGHHRAYAFRSTLLRRGGRVLLEGFGHRYLLRSRSGVVAALDHDSGACLPPPKLQVGAGRPLCLRSRQMHACLCRRDPSVRASQRQRQRAGPDRIWYLARPSVV
jgi:hypothetical protein